SKKLSGVDSKYKGSMTALREVFSKAPQENVQVQSDKLSHTLQEAKNNNRCTIESTLPEQTGRPQQNSAGNLPRFNISVGGLQCPVVVKTDVTMETPQADLCSDEKESTLCKFSAKVKMTFQVQDPGLQTELQVVSGEMNVTIEMNQMEQLKDGEFFAPVMKNKINADMKIVDLEGHAHIIVGHSEIDMTMSGMDMPDFEQSPSSGSVEMPIPMWKGKAEDEWSYSNDKTGEAIHLYATLLANDPQPVAKYYVNDVEVDAKTYEIERENFQKSLLIDAGMNGGPNGPNPGMPPGPGGPNGPGESENDEDPATEPADPREKWACMVEDVHTGQGIISIGYGAVEFAAKARAEEACRSNGGHYCDNTPKCAKQSGRIDAWFCKAENTFTSGVYSNVGRSIVEAQYLAKQKCLEASGNRGRYCESLDKECTPQ
ncbi:MAG: hypothetical protein AB7O96_15685, partial [Pseudobdellovibrionaceae bacterium]